MYDTETHSQFIGLRARGCSLSKIAEQLGVSFTTARNWDHEHYEEIRDLRDHFRALFVERFLPDYGELLDSLTRELKRINAELDKRDYSKEPTWVLVNRQSMILSRLDKIRANPPLLILPTPDPDPDPSPTESPRSNAEPTQNQHISDTEPPGGSLTPPPTLAPAPNPNLNLNPNPAPAPTPTPSESPRPDVKPTQNQHISSTQPPGGPPPHTLAPPTPPPNPSTQSTSSIRRLQETDPCRPQAPAPQPKGVLNRT